MKRKPMWMRICSGVLAQLLLLQSLPLSLLAQTGRETEGPSSTFAGTPLPVDLRTGAVVLQFEDLKLGNDRLPLALSRIHRSDMNRTEPGVFGYKWHNILDMRVIREGDALSLLDEQGRQRHYERAGDGKWISARHEYEAIRLREDGEWERHLKTGMVYRFGSDGRLAEITEPNGRFIRISRIDGEAGEDGVKSHAIRLEDRYGRFITVALSPEGRGISAQDSVGRRCVYIYDEQGDLKAFVNHAGGTVAMSYDADYRLKELNGAVAYKLAYDKDGRIAEQSTTRGAVVRYDYKSGNDGGMACRVTDASGAVSRFAFAADGHVTATDPTGVEESVWLNEREQPVKAVGADGQTAEIRYDERANPIEIIRNGVATRLTYAPDNALTSVATATGATMTFSYDDRRNVTAVENERGARDSFKWDQYGLLRTVREATGQSIDLDYDAFGQVTKILSGDGQSMTLRYDALGLLRELTTPTGVDVRYSYDPLGRLIGVENTEGQRVRTERDEQGRVVSVTDAANNVTRLDYDPAGLLNLVRDPVGAVTRLDYDALGRPASLTDSNSNVTRWTYDTAGRLLSEVDALGQPAKVAYDAQGRLREQVNRRGQVTALAYDEQGNMASLDLASAPAAFAYDAYGRSIGMSNADSDFAFTLTPDGLVERVADRKSGMEVVYEYDAAGRRIGMTAGGETVRYAYDPHGRLGTIESSFGRVTFEYDAFGRRAAMQYPNGVRTTYRYDKLNQILEIRAVDPAGGDVSRFRYTYDALGNRTQMIEGEDRFVNYVYDAANRLVRVADADKVTEYIYDAVGNRIAVLINGEREDYVTGKDNRLLKAGKAEFEYDADGNMVSRTTSEGQRYAYRYDAANRLIEATGPDGTVSYTYAPNGARISRTEAGEATRFVFDQEDMVFELVDGKIAARYLYGPGIDEPLALTREESSAYYHADGLGSITGLTDVKGSPLTRYTYDAFGKPMQAESRMVNPYRYTAREWDSKANSYFYRARFYLPEVGRFTALDPLGLTQGANLYAYCANNAVNFVDPSGLMSDRPKGMLKSTASLLNESVNVYNGFQLTKDVMIYPSMASAIMTAALTGEMVVDVAFETIGDVKNDIRDFNWSLKDGNAPWWAVGASGSMDVVSLGLDIATDITCGVAAGLLNFLPTAIGYGTGVPVSLLRTSYEIATDTSTRVYGKNVKNGIMSAKGYTATGGALIGEKLLDGYNLSTSMLSSMFGGPAPGSVPVYTGMKTSTPAYFLPPGSPPPDGSSVPSKVFDTGEVCREDSYNGGNGTASQSHSTHGVPDSGAADASPYAIPNLKLEPYKWPEPFKWPAPLKW